MRWALALMVMAACTDDVTFGQVQAIDDGSGTLRLSACLDAKLFSCGGSDVVLSARHDASSGSLTYTGFIFPEHFGSVPLGGRDQPVVIADGSARVEMMLPTPFELTSNVSEHLTSADAVNLQWEEAGEPMLWTADATCKTSPTYPSTGVDELDDDGELTLTIAKLEALMERPLSGCAVVIKLSRVLQGSVDDEFRADSATGIQRRTVRLTID